VFQKMAKPPHIRLNGIRSMSRAPRTSPCLGWPDHMIRSPGKRYGWKGCDEYMGFMPVS
jgi:hypothetical protein